MSKQRKIVLKKEIKTIYDKTQKYPRVYIPSAFLKELGITRAVKTVFVTLYHDRTITVEKAE